MCVGPHAIIRHVFVYVCVHVFVICIPVCHNGAALQILASSSGPPYPLFLPLSLFQVQRRFSNAITLTIWWEHQLNCCCFSAAWPAYRSNTHTAVRPRTFTHTHLHVHVLWLACVQIQTKPYGPSLSSFTVCNAGAAEGQQEPATPVFAGCSTQEEGCNKVMHAGC